MNNDLLRYSCQIALPGFSEASQQLLQQARVLIVGAGGLGCPAAQYLTSTGIGTIGIADFDTVSISNLHRQILYNPDDVGLNKAEVACNRLQKQNPGVKLIAHTDKIVSDNVLGIISKYDIVIDGTDNFETRYLLNDACVISCKPLVYGAIYQFEGQVAVWNIKTDKGNTPNYRDLFSQVDATQIPNCTEGGVIPTLAGIIGCMQANEVIKYITKIGELLAGKVLIFDAQNMQSRIIKIGDVTKTNIQKLVNTSNIPTISPSELKKRIDADNSIELVDVRTLQERDLHDIGGTHIALDEIEENLAYFTSETTKVLYCSSGKRSGEAVKLILKKISGAYVFSLDGGLEEFDNL